MREIKRRGKIVKELPTPPPIYVRPKERWFENYRCDDSVEMAAVVKLHAAMWLTFLDRTMRPIKEPKGVVGVLVANKIKELVAHHGSALMDMWREKCNSVEKKGDAEKTFSALLTGWRI